MPTTVCPADCCNGCCKKTTCTDGNCACDQCASGGEVCVGCTCQLACSPGCTTGSCCNNGSCASIHYTCNGSGGYTRVSGACGSTSGLSLSQAQATCGGWGCANFECIQKPSGGTYGFGSKALCDDFYSTSGNCQAGKGWVCCGGFNCNSNVCDYTPGNAGTYPTHEACVDVSSTCEKTKWVCSNASPAAGQSAYTCYPYPGVGDSETTCKASCGTWKCLTPSGATVGTCVLTYADSTGKTSKSLCETTTCCTKQCYSCDSTTLTCQPSLCTGAYPNCGTDQGQCQLESNGCGTYSCNASNACQFQNGKGGTYTTKATCQSSLCEDTHWECSGSSPAAGKTPYTCYEYSFAASGSSQFTSETICKQQSSGCGTYECSLNTCVFRNGPTVYPFATSSACTTSGCGTVKYVCNGSKTSCDPVYGQGVGDTQAQCAAKCGTYTCDAGTTPSCSFKSLNGTGYTLETTCNDNCKLIYCCKGTCAAGSHPNCSKDTAVGCSGRSTYSTQVLCETAELCCGETHWECRLKAGVTDPNIPGNTECLEVDGIYTPGTNYQNIGNCKAACGKSYSCSACTCSLITGLNGYDAFGICDAACPDMLYRCSNGKCVQDSCGGMTLETCKLTCGKYQCRSSVPVTSSTPCVFVSDTTTGYLTNTDCENNTYCRTVGRYVCTPVTCPGSTKPNGTICLEDFTECLTPPCTTNYYDTYAQCDASACQDPIAQGNRWKCTANQCEFVPYCDGDGTYLTQDDCRRYCYGFNCKNSKCIQEAGASASVNSCNSSCIIKWKLNTDASGCSTCVNIVGDQVIGVGTCCTKAADGSISCTPTPSINCPTLFDTSVACQAAIIAQNLQPHACKPISATSTICVPLSEYPSGTCGTYCNKALCDIGCLGGGGSGYVCVPPTDSQGRPVSGKFVCQLKQCGGTATYPECMGDCSARVSTGYNCVSTPSSSGSTFTSKCVSLQNPEDGIAQFSLLSRCKTFCLNNWGWTCKGNSCLKAWERPGQYGTQAECETFCVVPDQSPCGRVSELGQQRLLISSRGEQFDTYLDGSNPPEDPTVVPRNLFLTQNAQAVTSRIHDDGVFTSPDFIAGSCSEYPSLQLERPYQKSYSAPCNSYTGLYNSNPYSTCTKYWNKQLTPNISEKSKFTTRSMHWLNGGYFYGESSLRKYIYNQDGTIHFNTSVKYDPIDSRLDSPMDYIPQIRHGNNKTFYSMLNDGRFTNGRIFKLNLAANSLGYNYSVFKLQTSYLISVIDYSMHLNTFTKNFSSVFTVRDEPLYSCGSITCIDSDVAETASVDNITVMLSTGNITHFPLSNENVQKTRHNRASFIMTDNIYDTFYFDLITETKNLYSSVSFPDNPYGLLKCDISDNSYNSYFINNSTQTTYPIVTSSVSLTDGTVDYGNFKFKCEIFNDPITNTPYLVLKDNYYYTLYNKYNEEVIPYSSSEMAMNILDRILNYTKETYPQVNIHTTLYACTFSNGLQNITLDKTKNILKPGTVYVSHEIIKDATDSREDQYAMRINLSNPIEGAKLYGSTSVGMSINDKQVFMLMLKVSSSTSGYRNNTSDSTGSLISIDGNKYSFEDTNNSVILEKPLFAPNSSKFTTPDYTSIHTNTSSKILPLRGSEYSDIENNNYPTLRYVRKADGKFYIQILAGAFPYYHSIVHFPTLNELENCTPQDRSDNLCNKVVADSLLSVCSKNTDWYNHVATTKWVCHIKHTEFGDSPTEYSQTEEIKQKITGSGSKYVGKKPQPPTFSGGGVLANQAMNFNGTEFNPPPKTEFPEDFQL